MEQPRVLCPSLPPLPEAAPCRMTWLGDWLGLGWEAPPSGVGLYNSSDQKGNRSAAERAGNCTHSSQSSPETVRPGLANRQGWGALGVPEAQLRYDSYQSCSIRDGRGELRTAEGLPNSSASSWKASEGGKSFNSTVVAPRTVSRTVRRPLLIPRCPQAPDTPSSMGTKVTSPLSILLGWKCLGGHTDQPWQGGVQGAKFWHLP